MMGQNGGVSVRVDSARAGRTKRRWLRLVLKVVAVVALLAVVAAGVEAYRITTGLMSITGQTVSRDPSEPKITTLPTLGGIKRINILLLGTDTDTKANEVAQRNTDTMMIVTIDPVHHKVGLLSIPRDFWVNIPGYGFHKINYAYTVGGIRGARAEVERLFHITIHYYGWIGLHGFIKVVDTLGGVIVDAVHPIVDDTFPDDLNTQNPYAYKRVYIPAGPQYMDGNTALEYVRSRHGDLVGDFGRGARQEQILIGLRQKATGLNVLTHVPDLVSELQGHVKTDLTLDKLWPMATFARGIDPTTVQHVVLSPPLYSNTDTASDGESIVVPHWPAIMPLVHRMFAPVIVSPKAIPLKPTPIRIVTSPTPAATSPAPAPRPASTKVEGETRNVERFSGQIVFARNGDIWSYDGSNTRQITHLGDASDPSVTANGKWLAYVRRWSPPVSDIFTLGLRNGRTGQITNDRTTDGDISDNVWAYDPAYAPDGSSIVFASDKYKLANPPSDGRVIDLALYKYDVASGTTTELTTPGTGAGGNADPRFDPVDSNQVLFTSHYYLPSGSVTSQLTLLNLTSDNTTPLTPDGEQDLQPAWQPNSNHIAYIQNQGQGTRLLIASFHNGSLDTKHAAQIDSGMVAMPSFSPGGQKLAYYKVVGNSFHLFITDLTQGHPTGHTRDVLDMGGLDPTSPIVWTR